MKLFKTSHLTTALLVAIVAAPALAEDPAVPAAGPVPFESFDADGSGDVSQEEFNRMHSERIRVRSEEQRQFRNMGSAPGFSDIDTDGDGRLNRNEVNAHQQKRQEHRNQMRHENRERNRMDGPAGNGSGMGGGYGGKSSGGGMGGRK